MQHLLTLAAGVSQVQSVTQQSQRFVVAFTRLLEIDLAFGPDLGQFGLIGDLSRPAGQLHICANQIRAELQRLRRIFQAIELVRSFGLRVDGGLCVAHPNLTHARS